MKIQILLSTLLIFTFNSYSQIIDYRDSFIGVFQGTVFNNEYGFPDIGIIDSVNTEIKVEKFQGYTIDNMSNFVDVEYKVGITYDTVNPYAYIYKCSGPVYTFYGYIHPTIDSDGNLSYQELESCQNEPAQTGYLNGFINSDSIKIEFGYSDKWRGISRIIVGKRIVDNIGKVQLSSQDLFLFPNPGKDYIILKNLTDTNKVEICNVEGKIMYSSPNIPEEKITISSFPKGMYFIKVSDENSSKTLKFIKK